MYRTSDETPLVPALIEASENGKQSVCLVELKARFDERRNIEWSQALERAGVHVVYGFPNLKIHAKATLVVRREAGGLRRYVHIGTGNYHSVTARVYEDFGLFTADPEIAEDVANLFNYVTGFGKPEEFRKLLVAPFNLRDRLIEEIRRVAQAAGGEEEGADPPQGQQPQRQGDHRRAVPRLAGGREDRPDRPERLRPPPGVKGMSENIRVRSVLGRFLEHSRVFNFEARGDSGGTSWAAPTSCRGTSTTGSRPSRRSRIARLQQRLGAALDALLEDTTAWELQPDGTWTQRRPEEGRAAPLGPGDLMRSARAAAAPADGDRLSAFHHFVTGNVPTCRPGSRGECALDERCHHRRGVEHDPAAGRTRAAGTGSFASPTASARSASAPTSSATGAVSAAKLAEAAECLCGFADIARASGRCALDVVVASPGRQARNADQLVHVALARGRRARSRPVAGRGGAARVRGRARAREPGGRGRRLRRRRRLERRSQSAPSTAGPAWLRSVDLGSLRLSARVPTADPPDEERASPRSAARPAAAFEQRDPAAAEDGARRRRHRARGEEAGRPDARRGGARRRRCGCSARSRPRRSLAASTSTRGAPARCRPGSRSCSRSSGCSAIPLEVARGGLREGLALELLDRLPAVQAGGR